MCHLSHSPEPNNEENNSFFAMSFQEFSGYGAIKDTSLGWTW